MKLNRWLKYVAKIKRTYLPYLIFGIIVLSFIGLIFSRDSNVYYSKEYKYFIEFPEGWQKDYERNEAISFRSPEDVPIAMEPEAAVVVVANERVEGVNLSGHYKWILADIYNEGNKIINQGIGYVGLEEARWIEFQQANGTHNHIWYVFFNRANNLLIIQNRVSVYHVDKYRETLADMLESVRLK